jgi:signal transduction histidine kinase
MSISIALTLIIIFGYSSFQLFNLQREQALDDVRNKAIILTRALKNSIMLSKEAGHIASITTIFHTVGVLPGVEKLRVFNEEGMILYSARLDEIGKLTEELDYAVYRSPEKAAPFQSADTGHRSFCMVEPIENSPECYGCHDKTIEVIGVLDVCLTMEDAEKSIRYNRNLMLSFTGLSIVLTAALLSFMVRRFITRPIDDLVGAMRHVEAGNLEVQVDVRSKDELGSLSNSFNRMIERLDRTNKELEKFHHRQLLRVDRLASLGEMAAGVAHEIKNPLAGISGAAQVLSREFPAGDSRAGIMAEMITLINRLDNTIKNLLNFARYTEPEFALANINDVVEKVIFFVKQVAEGRKARFIREYDPSMEEIEVDSEQIKQVFLNLFLNALQAKSEDCEITVKTYGEAPPGFMESPHRRNFVMVSVIDNGPGMPPDKLSKIFQPFFTTKDAGTGLGLSITRKILDLHEGRVTVESDVGTGTSFHIFLPKKKL